MQLKIMLMATMLSAFLLDLGTSTAHAAEDEKHISSAICQAMTYEGSQHIKHLGSSLQALDANVTIMCPIVRDKMDSKLLFVEVRYLRPDGAANVKVSGKVYVCDAVFGGCAEKEAESDSTNLFTSVFIDTSNMEHDDNQYFYYRAVVPTGWKIVSIRHREE